MINWLKTVVHKWLFTYRYEIVLLDRAKMPKKAYYNDAGLDLYVSDSVVLKAGSITNVSTGVILKSSSVNAWIYLVGRSSTLLRHGLMVNSGIIDGDFTGELFMSVYNPTKKDVSIYSGMRIGQIIIMPHTSIVMKQVEFIKSSGRGVKGFGSTGE